MACLPSRPGPGAKTTLLCTGRPFRQWPQAGGDGADNAQACVHSSLKERAGVQRGSACGFAGAEVFAGHAEMAPWLPPFSAQVPVFVRAGELGQGPGGARPPAAAPEASLTRVPASR